MTIVIVDSGVSDRYRCDRINFPICTEKHIPPVAFGHGTAIYHIIYKKCSSFAKIINFRIFNIENGVEESVLIDALHYIDEELHPDIINLFRNLNLTYAVRDGIISHCGEVDENGLTPRDIGVSVEDFDEPGKYQAATWEGCVVKLADKIAYVGRDIEDAIGLGFLDQAAQNVLLRMAQANDERVLNTTVIMHNMIIDVCRNSSPSKGICLSKKFNQQLNDIKEFNYEHIYRHKRLEPFKHYSKLVITQIFNTLLAMYDGKHTWLVLDENRRFAPKLVGSFEKWLARYCNPTIVPKGELKELALRCENCKVYANLENRETYVQAIIDYISGMTDRYAIDLFNELLQY